MRRKEDKHEKVLFIGNGINRLSGNVSWKKLMKKLVSDALLEDTIDYQEEKPFPLLYEEIAFRMLEKRKMLKFSEVETDLKRKVADRIKELESNDYLKTFLTLDSPHILTTNYDYNIEQSCSGNDGKKANLSREVKYNLFRRRKVKGKCVWHVHGEINSPSSITLGYDHYAGQLQKMRNYFAEGVSSRKQNRREEKFKSLIIGSENYKDFMRKVEESERENKPYSWVDLFLCNDVHIVGFSLDYTEIDLWWLMIHKEKKRQEKKWFGKTLFYALIDEKESKKKKKKEAKLSLLKSCGVKVVPSEVKSNDYKNAYKDIFEKLKENCE